MLSPIRTVGFTFVTLCVFSGVAVGQKLPASTTIGSNPAGSLFYSVASGLAKVISEAGPMQSVVQPYTGSSTFLPLLDSGELDFGIINAVDMGLAYSRSGLLSDHRKIRKLHRHHRRYLHPSVRHVPGRAQCASNEVVHGSLKAVWDNIDKLAPLHSSLKEWTRERAVTPDATLPYHPAAVQFYKERNAWTPAMEELQKRLLALAS